MTSPAWHLVRCMADAPLPSFPSMSASNSLQIFLLCWSLSNIGRKRLRERCSHDRSCRFFLSTTALGRLSKCPFLWLCFTLLTFLVTAHPLLQPHQSIACPHKPAESHLLPHKVLNLPAHEFDALLCILPFKALNPAISAGRRSWLERQQSCPTCRTSVLPADATPQQPAPQLPQEAEPQATGDLSHLHQFVRFEAYNE